MDTTRHTDRGVKLIPFEFKVKLPPAYLFGKKPREDLVGSAKSGTL